MRSLIAMPAVLLLVLASGCGCTADKPAPAAAANTPVVQTGPMFDDLDYANWKRFPVNTTVQRKSVISSEANTSTVTSVETLALRKVTDSDIEVSRQNTTERNDGSYRAVNPAEVRRYPRQFAIPTGMTAEDFRKPSRSAKQVGEETVTVLGKDYKSTVYAWTDHTEVGPLEVRVWLSDDMPGRIVKQVMKQPTLKNTTIDEVIEVKIP